MSPTLDTHLLLSLGYTLQVFRYYVTLGWWAERPSVMLFMGVKSSNIPLIDKKLEV